MTMASLHKEALNGLSSIRSKVSSSTMGVYCKMETRVFAASTTMATGWSSPSYEKARMSQKWLKRREIDHADPSKLKRENKYAMEGCMLHM